MARQRTANPGSSPAHASLSESAAESANDIIDRNLQTLRGRFMPMAAVDDEIINPNGQRVRLSQFIDHDYFAEDHTCIFANDPGTYLIEPNPECMYVWPAKNDPHLYGRIRSGSYRPVGTDELRPDCPLPVVTHTVAGIEEDVLDASGAVVGTRPKRLVMVYDLVCMEVSPRAVKRLYRWPAFQAALRTKSNLPFERLKKQIEQDSKGYATAVLRSELE